MVGYFDILCLDSDHTTGAYRGELVLDEPAPWKVGAQTCHLCIKRKVDVQNNGRPYVQTLFARHAVVARSASREAYVASSPKLP